MSECRAYIYLLEGPSGVYVGLTTNPEKRLSSHNTCARRPGARTSLPVHRAVHKDGLSAWTMRVVACAQNSADAHGVESSLIQQLRREGKNVLNADAYEAARRGADKRRGPRGAMATRPRIKMAAA